MHDVEHDHIQSHAKVNYLGIFLALCVCTAVSVFFDVVHISPLFTVFAVLAVAVAKALFVLIFFMHLKFEGKWKFVILAPTTILAIGLMIGLIPDMALKYYTNDAAQTQTKDVEAVFGESDTQIDDSAASLE